MRRRLINGLMYLSMRADVDAVPELFGTIFSPSDLPAVVEVAELNASDSRFFPDRSDNRLCLRLTVCAGSVRERNSGATQEASEIGTSHIDGMISSGPDIEEADVVIDWHFLCSSSWFGRAFRTDSSGRCSFCKNDVDATIQDSPSSQFSAVRAEPGDMLSVLRLYSLQLYRRLELTFKLRLQRTRR